MKAKILELMQREGLKPSQMAEMLEISPAIISHILSERNKPSLDLLCKILRRFPQINPDWLLLDAPDMYRPETYGQAGPAATSGVPNNAGNRSGIQGGLFDVAQHGAAGKSPAQAAAASSSSEAVPPADAFHRTGNGGDRPAAFPLTDGFRADNVPVTRVVICYADGSFESFFPTRR